MSFESVCLLLPIECQQTYIHRFDLSKLWQGIKTNSLKRHNQLEYSSLVSL